MPLFTLKSGWKGMFGKSRPKTSMVIVIARYDEIRALKPVQKACRMFGFLDRARTGDIPGYEHDIGFRIALIDMIDTARQIFCHRRDAIGFLSSTGDMGITDLRYQHPAFPSLRSMLIALCF